MLKHSRVLFLAAAVFLCGQAVAAGGLTVYVDPKYVTDEAERQRLQDEQDRLAQREAQQPAPRQGANFRAGKSTQEKQAEKAAAAKAKETKDSQERIQAAYDKFGETLRKAIRGR